MPLLRELLPSALICVDERERDDYTSFVPKKQLVTHPKLVGLPRIHNWLLKAIDTPILFRVDDDFRRVIVMTGSERIITDSKEIRDIIENSAVNCRDLGLGVFCYTRQANPIILRPNEKPICPVHPVCSAFGVMNRARYREMDQDLHGRADVDYTLQTLLEDRLVYADCRFYFDFGPIGYGTGGTAGLLSDQDYKNASHLLFKRWGKSLNDKQTNLSKEKKSTPLRIAVKRVNTRAQK